jgi:hypothetical protein
MLKSDRIEDVVECLSSEAGMPLVELIPEPFIADLRLVDTGGGPLTRFMLIA